jgi:hypothetical protein
MTSTRGLPAGNLLLLLACLRGGVVGGGGGRGPRGGATGGTALRAGFCAFVPDRAAGDSVYLAGLTLRLTQSQALDFRLKPRTA